MLPGWSSTDFVNSGSYLRAVLVFISGITTLVGLASSDFFFTGTGGAETNFIVLPETTPFISAFFSSTCFAGGGGGTGFFTSILFTGLAATTGFAAGLATDFLATTAFLGGAGLAAFLGAGFLARGFLAGAAFFT